MSKRYYFCEDCSYLWRTKKKMSSPSKCSHCNSKNVGYDFKASQGHVVAITIIFGICISLFMLAINKIFSFIVAGVMIFILIVQYFEYRHWKKKELRLRGKK